MHVELFQDRREAGRRLSEALLDYKDRNAIVLAIPRGGVPVGYEIAQRLDVPLDVIVPRKLPVPWNPEAGFGAVMPDGTFVLNDRMVSGVGLEPQEISRIVEDVHAETVRRMKEYRDDKPLSDVKDRPVLIVDDGLASGYTMLAAIESLRKQMPACIVVAVPTASNGASRLVGPKADRVVSLIISERLPFAVASFYREWRDLTDEEVKDFLRRSELFGEPQWRAAA